MSQVGTYDEETGQANTGVGRLWGGITGKHGPTAPRLPRGFEWLGPVLQQVGQTAAGNIDYGASNAAQTGGIIGTAQGTGLASGINTGDVASTFGQSLNQLNEGAATGYLPSLEGIDALLRPTLERSFDAGAADIREQNALTGNLSSSGTGQQIVDFRSQLENQLGSNVAGIYGAAIPGSIAARSGAVQLGTSLPALLQQGVFGNLSQLGLQGQQFPLQALQTSTGAVSGAPFSANQGSAGNAGFGTALGSYLSKGTA